MSSIYWLASYPKSGNTWLRSFITSLCQETPAPVDINQLQTGSIASARGWMDEVLGFDTAELSHDEIDRLRPAFYRWAGQACEKDSYHKCHDAYTFLKNGEPLFPHDAGKGVIYILRNPLDVSISYANHCNVAIDRSITMMNNADAALAAPVKQLTWQLRQKLLTWSGHVLSWVDEPGLKRLIIRYEDMRLAPLPTFRQIAAFLNLPGTENDITTALANCDFFLLQQQEQQGNFRERPANAPRFFRKGRVGDWQQTLNSEQIGRIITDHAPVMRRFGYLDQDNSPLHPPGSFSQDSSQ